MGAARTCLFVITIHLIHAVTAQDKRLGFIGMRGKKFLDQDDLRQPQLVYNGGRGKKSMYDFENEEKRAPMSFIGMRGKKPFSMDMFYPEELNRGPLSGEIDYSPDESYETNNRLYDLLTQYQMRLQSDVAQSGPESSEYDMNNEINKRANIHQFYGVRGKKAEGKGPYGKFIAVRGKKDLKNNAQEIKILLPNGPWPKRKAQMGFIGMRGKKWDESSLENETPN